MPQYRRVGDVPPKRHIVHRSPSGRLAEELMGEEGFSGASSLLYHRYSPSAILSAETVVIARDCPAPNDALRPLHLRLGTFGEAGDPVTGRRSLARQRRRHPLLGARHAVERAVPERGRRRGRVRRRGPRRCSSRSSGASRSGRATTSSCRPRRRTAGWSTARDPCGCWSSRRAVTSRIPARYLTATGQLREGAPYSERDLRGPEGPLTVEGEQVPVLIRHRSGWARHVHACHPVRRRRLGRLCVPVRLFDPRLRADRRAAPPTAAGAPDVRGTGLRGVQLRAAAARLRSRGGPSPVPPRQRRQRRGALLRRRRLHEPVGSRDRANSLTLAPRRLRARTAAGQRRGRGERQSHRRDRRDGRHVSPARGHAGCARRLRRSVPAAAGHGRRDTPAAELARRVSRPGGSTPRRRSRRRTP